MERTILSPLRMVPLVSAVTGLFLLAGRGDDPSAPKEDVKQEADVRACLQALPSWDAFAEVQDTADQPVGDEFAEMADSVLCTQTPYSITQNPEAIVTFGSAPNVLYLGSLIQGKSLPGWAGFHGGAADPPTGSTGHRCHPGQPRSGHGYRERSECRIRSGEPHRPDLERRQERDQVG